MSHLSVQALHNVLDLERDGVHEQGGNNVGPVVDKVIRYAGGQIGEPWCVDTVIWGYGHAHSHVVRPGFPRAVTAMFPHPGIVRTTNPDPGDPVRYIHAALGVTHVELFIGWRRAIGRHMVACPQRLATHVYVVGGNTGASGAVRTDGNGTDGVYRKYRPRGYVTDFLRVLS